MNRYSVYLLRENQPPECLEVGTPGAVIDAVIDLERSERKLAETQVVPVDVIYRSVPDVRLAEIDDAG